MKYSIPTVLQLTVLTLFCFSTSLTATDTPFFGNAAPEFAFVETEVSASPGEVVQVCLIRETSTNAFGKNSTQVVDAGGDNDHSLFTGEINVTFLPGVDKACFDLPIKEHLTEANYELELLGSEEELLLNVESKELLCGSIPKYTTVAAKDAAAMDRYGNYYSKEVIEIPEDLKSYSDCGCDELGINLTNFEPFFEDCAYETGEGFNHPTLGPARRTVFCAALQYLDQLIVPNKSVCNPEDHKKVNIQVLPSNEPANYPLALSPIASNIGGYASAYYSARDFYIGIEYPWPWIVINSGVSPLFGEDNLYHALTRINFSNPNWNLEYTSESTPEDRSDLYSLVLHELTHAIGFSSAFNNTSGLLGSREGTGSYFGFDPHIQITYPEVSSTLNLLVNGTSEGYPFSNSWEFNADVDGLGVNDPEDPSDLHSSCQEGEPHLTFKGLVSSYP